ncbi:unnamed protein product [Linum trigynum]|uniref:Uncharacterized protein n=1 Tax=Linum trigynum TaxID=586398 RepID=A0AAV2FLX2_9ROSI
MVTKPSPWMRRQGDRTAARRARRTESSMTSSPIEHERQTASRRRRMREGEMEEGSASPRMREREKSLNAHSRAGSATLA